ncbi:hypothetical protein AB1N83_005490 [Pleurotus pulmonarius]|nr:hypothetical protein EYR38_007870 [Pleurotus pulmonarius]
MIPKFSNPHFLALSEQPVTRSELREPDNEQEPLPTDVLTKLEETLKRNIEDALYVDSLVPNDGRKRKKQKLVKDISPNVEHEVEGNVVSFRLFSTRAHPELVSLAPLPPPPSIYREPECEDSPEMAKKRALFSRQVAVDAEWVAKQAAMRYMDPFSRGPLLEAALTSSLNIPSQSILLLERPLPTTHKLRSSIQQPHEMDASVLDGGPPPLARVPVLNITPPRGEIADQTKIKQKRKRVRGKTNKTERPPPRYWAPDPAWGGKGLGYAFGYPSHLNNAYSYDYGDGHGGSAVNSGRAYRDTMKKAVASATSG